MSRRNRAARRDLISGACWFCMALPRGAISSRENGELRRCVVYDVKHAEIGGCHGPVLAAEPPAAETPMRGAHLAGCATLSPATGKAGSGSSSDRRRSGRPLEDISCVTASRLAAGSYLLLQPSVLLFWGLQARLSHVYEPKSASCSRNTAMIRKSLYLHPST